MNDSRTREQLRRQFLDQAAAAFDRMFPLVGDEAPVPLDQREQRARELGQQLISSLLQRQGKSDAGFYQDIVEHPDDDTPRLVYADWLDDHGQPARAEFIRLQCRLAKLDPHDPDRRLLELREEELSKEHGPAWMAHLPVWAQKAATLQRGFVNHLSLPAKRYLRDGKTLRQQAPLDSLRLTELDGKGEKLVASGLLEGIRHLAVVGNVLSLDDLIAILRSSQLRHLTSLTIDYCPAGEEACRALVSNPHLGQLRRLSLLHDTDFRHPQASILSRAPLLGQLEELDLGGSTELGTAGVQVLAHSPHWRRLRRLSFRHCYLDAEAVRELVRSPAAQGLTALDLVGASLSGAASSLANSPSLANLVHLDVTSTGIGNGGLVLLSHATHLPRLTALRLTGNEITTEGVRALTQGTLLGQLTRIDLACSRFGTAGMRLLAGSPACGRLRHLDLSFCDVGPDGAAALAGSPHLSQLDWLSLYANGIGEPGARSLAESARLPSLRYLNAGLNRLGNEGAVALAESPLGKQLLRLVLSGSGVRMELRRNLQARHGHRMQF